MMDILEKNGGKIDTQKLSLWLGCPVVKTSALKGDGLSRLSETAVNIAKGGQAPKIMCRFSARIEKVLKEIENLIKDICLDTHLRFYTIKVFERDEKVLKQLKLPPKVWEKIDNIITKCEKEFDDDSESIIINERYDYIAAVIKACVVRHKTDTNLSEKIDSILTNRYLALPIFALIMCAVYYISSQSIGNLGSEWLSALVSDFGEGVRMILEKLNVAVWLSCLIVDGFISGVGSVLTFIPQLILLFLALALLEDCGYMARIAFIMDRLFKRFGLSGKSFIPLLVASGCGVPGIMACRTIESEKDRKITIMVTTFVPCGAKLPIISLIAGALFNNSALVAISVYFMGILMVGFSGAILKKTHLLTGNPAPFVMELPNYHIPSAKNVLRHVADETKAFVIKAGTIIFIGSGIIWFLSNFSWSLKMVETEHSILASVGKVLTPLFVPLGFGHWQPTVATLTGIVAKENIVSSLNILYGFENPEAYSAVFTTVSAYAFLAFNMLCSPCVAAIGAIRREIRSTKWTVITLAYQTALAYAVALIIYQLGSFFIFKTPFNLCTAAACALILGMLWLLLRRNLK